ncbi:MAG: S49 family peptidase, partial [Candidatus Omnitrophica bacterium]|nr:S49 family peptidase [Candidatus Omnitrophota bacterium]
FVDEVATGRNMSRSDVKDLADGRIYTGEKAKSLGLVDDFGNMYDAIEKAGELAGIDGEPAVIYMNRPTLSRLLFGSETDSSQAVEQFASYFEDSPFGKITA